MKRILLALVLAFSLSAATASLAANTAAACFPGDTGDPTLC